MTLTLRPLRNTVAYADLDLQAAERLADDGEKAAVLLHQLNERVTREMVEMTHFREWCLRADQLYYSNDITLWGADLWAKDASAVLPGRTHLSVNTPAVYVDVPAAWQALQPIENMLATDTTDDARDSADQLERIYYAWKRAESWELKVHKACTTKGLYGRTAAFVYWDPDENRPCVRIIDQPSHLWLGWKTTAYDSLDWAAYVTRMSPMTVVEEFGVDVVNRTLDDQVVPFVRPFEPSMMSMPDRPWLTFGPAMIEVWEYWYRVPIKAPVKGSGTKMMVHRALFVGNLLVSDEEHAELKGKLPVVPLFNTFLPGVSNGRSDLYDVEQLIYEKMHRLTDMATMIHAGAAGNYFQLTGAEAPNKVPGDLKPRLNEVVAPGAGNRIEVITPFIPQF